jgi:hypothetical protein
MSRPRRETTVHKYSDCDGRTALSLSWSCCFPYESCLLLLLLLLLLEYGHFWAALFEKVQLTNYQVSKSLLLFLPSLWLLEKRGKLIRFQLGDWNIRRAFIVLVAAVVVAPHDMMMMIMMIMKRSTPSPSVVVSVLPIPVVAELLPILHIPAVVRSIIVIYWRKIANGRTLFVFPTKRGESNPYRITEVLPKGTLQGRMDNCTFLGDHVCTIVAKRGPLL